jgi:hypothetical protein
MGITSFESVAVCAIVFPLTDEKPCCIDGKLCAVRRDVPFRVDEHEIRFLYSHNNESVSRIFLKIESP